MVDVTLFDFDDRDDRRVCDGGPVGEPAGGALVEVTGDLLEGGWPAIGHGCNLAGVMGAGIAAAFARRWPEMVPEYRQACRSGALRLGGFHTWGSDPVIYNLGTQPRPGRCASLAAVADAVTAALHDCAARGIVTLALPRVGAGIGGLHWPQVRLEMQRAAAAVPGVQLVVVALPPRR